MTTPNSTRMPRAEYTFNDSPPSHRLTSPNGTARGSENRMVKRVDEVLELRRQQQVHEDERQHERPAKLRQRPFQFASAAQDCAWRRPAACPAPRAASWTAWMRSLKA